METTNVLNGEFKKALDEALNSLKDYEFECIKKLKDIYGRFSVIEFCEKTNPINKISMVYDNLKEKWLGLENPGFTKNKIDNSIVGGILEEKETLSQKDELYLYFKDKATKLYRICIYGEKTDFEEIILS